MDKTCVLVVGMHRSGTSALTRMLAGVGCGVPRTLMPADDHNELGYWESSPIAELNDAILESAGTSWDDWGAFNPAWASSPVAQGFRERAIALLAREFGDSPLFALKDPRICRLPQFWMQVLEAFGAAPCFAMPIRNPLEVAASLEQRDGIEPPFGLLLWLRNVLDAEAGSRRCPRTTVRYDELLGNWEQVATQMSRDLAIAWPKRSTVADLEIEASVSPALRHQARPEAEALAGPAVSGWVKTTYSVLNRWTRGDPHPEDVQCLDAVRAAFDEAEAAFRRPLVAGARARKRETSLRGDLDALRKQIADKDAELATLGDALTEKDAGIEALDRAVRERDGKITTLERTIEEQYRRVQTLIRTDAEKGKAITHLQTELEALLASSSWRITKPLRTARRLAAATPRALAKLARAALYHPARLLWRLVPLPGPRREGIRRAALRLLGKRQPAAAAPQLPRTTGYVASGRMGLPERNRLAADGGGAIPVLFDSDWYLENNQDVAHSGMAPLEHYLSRGAVEGRLPMPMSPNEIDPDIETLHRLNVARPESFALDAALYRALHPDLNALDCDALASHYRRTGQAEGRIATKGHFVQALCGNPAEIPLDFQASEYIDLYPDLDSLRGQPPFAALQHYMQHGRWAPRLHTSRGDPRQQTPPAAPPATPPAAPPANPSPPSLLTGGPTLCVLVHVFYPELWPELAGYIHNLPVRFHDLYVNVVDSASNPTLLEGIRADFPHARVYVSNNKGRDIGGHFQLLRHVTWRNYRVFCLLHTKKSPHLAPGDALLWRRRLLMPLLGSPQRAVENVARFLDDASLGQLGAEACRDTTLAKNRRRYVQVLEHLQIPKEGPVEFVAGTMMFVRGEVLNRLFEGLRDIPFEPGDKEPLAFHLDGQWAHAIERAISPLAGHMGYRTAWR